MSRTQRRNDSDQGQPDGHIFIPVRPADVFTGGGATQAQNNGIPYVNLPTASTYYGASIVLDGLLLRYGVQDDLQEAFGSSQPIGAQGQQVGQPATFFTAATVGLLGTVITSAGFEPGMWVSLGGYDTAQIQSIPDATHIQFVTLNMPHYARETVTANLFTTPAGVSGSPPFPGVSQFTPVTAPRPKGIMVKQIDFVYQVIGSAISNHSFNISGRRFRNGQSPSAIGGPGGNLGGSTDPGSGSAYSVTNFVVPKNEQSFFTSRDTMYLLQWFMQTGAGGSANMVGVFLDVVFNYN